MKYLSFAFLITFTKITFAISIYGVDNRHDVYTETNPLFKTLALSTAALIDNMNLSETPEGIKVSGRPLGQIFQLCENQKFRHQVSAAHCSGTLVAPDIIMTAGHCYAEGNLECRGNSWVFDFKASKPNQDSVTVPKSSVYRCSKILTIINDPFNGADHALIKLDRPVTGRSPIALSKALVKLNDPLVMIGHPLGIPTKITDDASVKEVEATSFLANLDAFSINSGSGVFHAKTGEILGILSSGPMDGSSSSGCTVARVFKQNDGQEQVMRIDSIRNFLKTLP